MRIVVAGGTGFLGSALVEALRRDAHQVSVLTRRARQPEDVYWSPGDPGGAWKSAIDGADAVINLAGEGIADRRWTSARKHAILDSRVTATRALVSAIRESRREPGVLISASGINIYPSQDEPSTEDSPHGSDFLTNVCKTWEAEALAASTVSTRVVLLRSGMVIEKRGGALPRMALPFRLFAGGPFGSGRQYMSWIHRDDWVSMVRWALLKSDVAGPLNLTAPKPVRNAAFAHTLGHVLHRPAFVPAPAFALRIAVGEMADAMLLSSLNVVPKKALSNGFAFRYPTLEGALRAIYEKPSK
jgi:uncharacterized protein